ncbi:MAG: hypothetical protein M0C28_26950 [Candidatus Moduliflexus flocculans]|nr:hypothetical protein [Candidatus Moduliflexus flocculans]
MIEKTLRYPGHVERIRALRASGFFDAGEIEVRGVRVRPLDVSSAVLFKHWHLEEEDDEFTVMRIVVAGHDGRPAQALRLRPFRPPRPGDRVLVHGPDDGLPGDRGGPPHPVRAARPQRASSRRRPSAPTRPPSGPSWPSWPPGTSSTGYPKLGERPTRRTSDEAQISPSSILILACLGAGPAVLSGPRQGRGQGARRPPPRRSPRTSS